jgi:hypothetical protein
VIREAAAAVAEQPHGLIGRISSGL